MWTAGRREGEEKRTRLLSVLSSVLSYLDYRLKRQGIDYQQDVEDDLVLPVAPHDLEELFLNITINAIQAMESGGRLWIKAHRSDFSGSDHYRRYRGRYS